MSTDLLPLAPGRRDVVRLAVQAAVSGTAAALAIRLTGTGEAFLAVISAVFVLQRNRDATLASAGSRMLGTLVGTAIGLAALALAQPGALPWPLALAMLAMGGLAAWKPSLRYGIVAAAGLAIGSEAGFLDTARDRSIAIFLGATIGILTGWLVFAESAAARARRQTGEALAICRDLFERMLDGVAAGEAEEEIDRLHARFYGAIATARETAQSVGGPRSGPVRPHLDLVHRTERLWHALIILDRVRERAGNERAAADGPGSRLQALREAVCAALSRAARLERIPEDELDAIGQACAGAGGEGVDAAAWRFGLEEIARNLSEIDAAIGEIRND